MGLVTIRYKGSCTPWNILALNITVNRGDTFKVTEKVAKSLLDQPSNYERVTQEGVE